MPLHAMLPKISSLNLQVDGTAGTAAGTASATAALTTYTFPMLVLWAMRNGEGSLVNTRTCRPVIITSHTKHVNDAFKVFRASRVWAPLLDGPEVMGLSSAAQPHGCEHRNSAQK